MREANCRTMRAKPGSLQLCATIDMIANERRLFKPKKKKGNFDNFPTSFNFSFTVDLVISQKNRVFFAYRFARFRFVSFVYGVHAT